MQFEHTFPANYDHNWIIGQAGVVAQYSVARGATNTVLSYAGTQEQFDAIDAVIAAYPVDYATTVLKPAMLNELRDLREAKVASGCATPFGTVDTDAFSLSRITGVVAGANAAITLDIPFGVNFTKSDETKVALNAQDALVMGLTVMAYVSGCHDRYSALKEDIEAAANQDELQAIDVTTGWP